MISFVYTLQIRKKFTYYLMIILSTKIFTERERKKKEADDKKSLNYRTLLNYFEEDIDDVYTRETPVNSNELITRLSRS